MRILCLSLMVVLGGCERTVNENAGPSDEYLAETVTPETVEPEVNTDVVEDPLISSFLGSEFSAIHSSAGEEGYGVRRQISSENLAIVSGDFSEAAPSVTTAGAVYFIRGLPEQRASGRTVEVRVVAKGGPFAVAYSTADVGNSGWNQFGSSEDWAQFTFTYDVPQLVNGNGDFVGVIPTDPNSDIEIESLSVVLVN